MDDLLLTIDKGMEFMLILLDLLIAFDFINLDAQMTSLQDLVTVNEVVLQWVCAHTEVP